MHTLFALASRGASVDTQSGLLSIFEVLESINAPQLPAQLQEFVSQQAVRRNGLAGPGHWKSGARCRGTHPHDLRNGYASVQIPDGVPVTQLAAQLGHSKKSLTLDVYSHVLTS